MEGDLGYGGSMGKQKKPPFPSFFVRAIAEIAVYGALGAFTALFWARVDSVTIRVAIGGLYLVLMALLFWNTVRVDGKIKRVKRALGEEMMLLCPECLHPVCSVHRDDASVVCSECGYRASASEIWARWMRLPKFRYALKKTYGSVERPRVGGDAFDGADARRS